MPHYTSLRAHCSFLKWCCICLIIEISYQEWAFISRVICKSVEPLFPDPFVCVLILFVFPDIHKGEPICAFGSRKNCAKFFNYKNIFLLLLFPGCAIKKESQFLSTRIIKQRGLTIQRLGYWVGGLGRHTLNRIFNQISFAFHF